MQYQSVYAIPYCTKINAQFRKICSPALVLRGSASCLLRRSRERLWNFHQKRARVGQPLTNRFSSSLQERAPGILSQNQGNGEIKGFCFCSWHQISSSQRPPFHIHPQTRQKTHSFHIFDLQRLVLNTDSLANLFSPEGHRD